MPFFGRSSCDTRHCTDRKSSFLVPAACLEVHRLTDGLAMAGFLRDRSLHNRAHSLTIRHGLVSVVTYVSVLVSYSLADLWNFLCACSPCQLEALDLRFKPRPEYRGLRWVFKAIADERRIIVFDVHIEFT